MIEGPVLVLASHPDDEVLGCGGTIARLAQDGVDVDIAILGEGVTSRYADRDEADLEEISAPNETSESCPDDNLASPLLGVASG